MVFVEDLELQIWMILILRFVDILQIQLLLLLPDMIVAVTLSLTLGANHIGLKISCSHVVRFSVVFAPILIHIVHCPLA